MSNLARSLAVLLPGLVLAFAFSIPARAAVPTARAGDTSQARLGFGRSYRAPSSRSRYRARPLQGRRYRRPGFSRGFFGGILRALGIAYLFHVLFGWGSGGSPLGLLLLAVIVLFLVSRRRRRVAYY